MPRLFDELEAGPDPGPLDHWYSTNMGARPTCLECRESVPVPEHHLDPGTGDYTCRR